MRCTGMVEKSKVVIITVTITMYTLYIHSDIADIAIILKIAWSGIMESMHEIDH